MFFMLSLCFFFSVGGGYTSGALWPGVQTCALPISLGAMRGGGKERGGVGGHGRACAAPRLSAQEDIAIGEGRPGGRGDTDARHGARSGPRPARGRPRRD